jgi:HD-GYP domain-containing protein (c-di-GMP phosphodiesterase class II)
MNLSTLTDPWSIINNSTFGETGSVERSPAISAMAGLISMNLEKINTEGTILAGLLSDIGSLLLPPALLKKIRQGKMNELTKEELAKYQQHPIYSINKCLEKKVPLTDDLKNIMMSTHEKMDRTGFPKKMGSGEISKESQLLHFCEIVDQRLLLKMGEKAENARDLQMKILEEEISQKRALDFQLSSQLKQYLQESGHQGKAA